MPRPEATRSAKWKARRDVIIDTSAQVFARQGYHATGIAELCTVNGLGKGAFYHYIASKEELLAAIHDRVMDEVMVGADRVAASDASPSAQLAMLGDELLDVIHRYPDHVWVFLHEFPALTAERAEQFRVRRREYERRVEALKAGYDEAILLNTSGTVSEATGENLFVVKGGVLKTPPLSSGALEGITRDSVMTIARDLGYEVTVEPLLRTDLYLADEAFLTGTAAEVVPIREVDDREIGDPGEMTRKIQETYFAAVHGEVEKYADWLEHVRA